MIHGKFLLQQVVLNVKMSTDISKRPMFYGLAFTGCTSWAAFVIWFNCSLSIFSFVVHSSGNVIHCEIVVLPYKYKDLSFWSNWVLIYCKICQIQKLLLILQIPESTVQFTVACDVALREKFGHLCLFTHSKYWVAHILEHRKCPL